MLDWDSMVDDIVFGHNGWDSPSGFSLSTHLGSGDVATPAGSEFPMPDNRFGQLIAAARAGDQPALGDLLQDCRDYLLLVANQDIDSQMRPKVGASDLVQESMLTAQASFDQFQGTDREQLLAWLRQILKNDMRQAYRYHAQTDRRQINRESPIDDSRQLGKRLPGREYTPSTQAGIHEEGELLEQAMSELPRTTNKSYGCGIGKR